MKTHFDPVPYEGEKITTASEMAALEKKAIEEKDAASDTYMQKAADGIFSIARSIMIDKGLGSEVTIFVGKGNNGGDGVCVGRRFFDEDCNVTMYFIAPVEECSELTKKHAKEFQAKGGKITVLQSASEIEFPKEGIIIDALLGTGFKGKVTGLAQDVIEKINKAHNFVLSVDIPSGVPGDTGMVEGSAVYADHTVYLGMIKVGHLFYSGYDHVGEVSHVDFGMSKKYVDSLKPFGYLVNPEVMIRNLPRHSRTAHKYSVGQMVVIGGSRHMPGAPLLAAEAGLRSGAGIVKWFHPEEMYGNFTNSVREVIQIPFSRDRVDELEPELKRAKAVLLGPGLGREDYVPKLIEEIYRLLNCPVVIDADALYFFKEPPVKTVLTPHHGELIHLLGVDSHMSQLELLDRAEEYCQKHDVVIVAKGAPTVILAKNEPRIISARGNPGMATAGTGDVLAGIITSFIAQGLEPRAAAILGVTFHSIAGDLARGHRSEHAMIASDIISELPTLFLRCE